MVIQLQKDASNIYVNILDENTLSENKKYELYLYNSVGQLVLQKEIHQQNFHIEKNKIINGVYYFKIINKDYVSSGKFIND